MEEEVQKIILMSKENFSFEANTTYTFSVYTKNYSSTTDSQFRFFVNLTDGDNYPIDSQTSYSEPKLVGFGTHI